MKRTQLIGVLLASFAGGTQAQEAKPAAASEQAYTQVYYNVGSNMVTWGYYAINLAAAQNAGITGRGVKVAVFDTGLAITNPKFNSNVRQRHHRCQQHSSAGHVQQLWHRTQCQDHVDPDLG